MTQLAQTLLFAAAGLAAGFAAHTAFRRMPDAWLLDYDQTTAPADFAARRSFPLLPHGLLLTLLVALLYARIPAATDNTWYRAAAMLAVPILLLVLVADWKTRIIPDQLTLLLIVPGLVQAAGDGLAGTPWLTAIGLPLAAGAAAGGTLLLVGLIGQLLLRREAMGMGDVKLIAAAAFMTGWSRLPHLVMLSFLTAAVIAIPLLVRIRLAERHQVQADAAAPAAPAADAEEAEEAEAAAASTAIADTSEPAAAVPEQSAAVLEAAVDTASSAAADTAVVAATAAAEETEETEEAEDIMDDPSAIAFGPFIAIAALLLRLFPAQIDQLVNAYWSLLVR